MMTSPGWQNARYTARFAGLPEYGCTFTWMSSADPLAVLANKARTRSIASSSTWSIDLLALVVPLAGVTLGVLVGETRARRLHHRARRVVLARDEAHGVVLAMVLFGDEVRDFGIDLRKRRLAHARSMPQIRACERILSMGSNVFEA